MSDDKVVDIKTRRGRSVSPSVLAMAEQLVAMEGIRETVAVLAVISHDFDSLQLFEHIPSTPEIRERVHDIIQEAVIQLERLEDSLG